MITAAERFALSRMNSTAYRHEMGKMVDRSLNCVRGRYSFAVQGGAVGSVNLLEDLNDTQSTIILPDNAVIWSGVIDILTAMVSVGGTGTIALTANSAGDLKAAVDADTLSGLVATIPVGSAATAIKLTADRTLLATIATAALTAGIFDLYLFYMLGN